MGTDWTRMRLKQGADRAELKRLVSRQAEAFQGMPAYWDTDPQAQTSGSYYHRTRDQFEPAYLEASEALKERLDFSHYDYETDQCCDYPDLAPCWRVYPITGTKVFPPPWRLRAHRTILPDELASQIKEWRDWLSAVESGQFRRYLFDLYVYEATMLLYVHDELLRELAEVSMTRQTMWARRPEVVAVRQCILASPAPQFAPAPIGPPAEDENFLDPTDDARYRDLWQRIVEVCRLNRDWNEVVSADVIKEHGWKLDGWDIGAHPDFECFLAQAHAPRLLDFLNWAETCSSLGMGLFLDY